MTKNKGAKNKGSAPAQSQSQSKPQANQPKLEVANPTTRAEKQWAGVKAAFEEMARLVSSGRPKNGESMQAYTEVLMMIQKEGNSGEVYEASQCMLNRYLEDKITNLKFECAGEELLQAVYKAWHTHQIIVKWADSVFGYLNRYHVQTECKERIKPMTMRCFLTSVFEKVKERLISILMEQVKSERDGKTVNRQVLRESTELYIEMGLDDQLNLYRKEFQSHYLAKTTEYYQSKSAKWLADEGGLHLYLQLADAACVEEEARAKAILHVSSYGLINTCMRETLLNNNAERIMLDPKAGMRALLQGWKVEEVGRMFRVFHVCTGGVEIMSNILFEVTEAEGLAHNQKLANGAYDSVKYVEAVFALHDRFNDLVKEHCQTEQGTPHIEMLNAVHRAFLNFVNEPIVPKKGTTQISSSSKITIAELLSGYCDVIVKNDKLSPDEYEATLNRVMNLFGCITEKDLFQEFLRKSLSKRLLLASKLSDTKIESDRQLITKLKVKMGLGYTAKLESMIQDKATSEDAIGEFKEWSAQQKRNTWGFEFTAQVLTSSHWPPFKIEPVSLPQTLAAAIETFTKFYDSKNSSRKLTWPHSLGNGVVTRHYNKGVKEMTVATFQICVMLELNNGKPVSVNSLMNGVLKMDKDDAKRTILSLSFGKFPILVKVEEDKKKTVNETELFKVNEAFSIPQRKFKIPMATKVSGSDPVEKTDEARKHVIDATIVRIMKSRKSLHHQELVTECIKQLSALFKPDPKMIKKRIEDVISRGYLERQEADRNTYNYLT